MAIIVAVRNTYRSAQQQTGQFMTPPGIAAALAKTLPALGRASVLEVGAGDGALLSAAKLSIRQPRATAIEIDRELAKMLAQSGHEVIIGDATKPRVWRDIQDRRFDVVLGNPPYAVYQADRLAASVVEWGLGDPVRGPRLDTLFLAESLSRLKQGGSGAFILPLSLLTDRAFQGFRRKLTSQFGRVTAIELPSTAFPRAEVRTAICSFSGTAAKGCSVVLACADAQGAVLKELAVSASDAQLRADFTYHSKMRALRRRVGRDAQTLAQLGAEVVRGSETAQRFAQMQVDCLHTTDFPDEGIGRLRYRVKPDHPFKVVRAGDIVVPRLGSRCLLRQAIVVSGASAYTESVYRVRVPKAHRQAILGCLAGQVGETWREIHAKGSCAKHLTVADLLSMPVPL